MSSNRGVIWFDAGMLEDGRVDEHVDLQFNLLSGYSEHNVEGRKYSYALADIDKISGKLGIPWLLEKDIPFSHRFPFTGFLWDLNRCTIRHEEREIPGYDHSIVTYMHT